MNRETHFFNVYSIGLINNKGKNTLLYLNDNVKSTH